MHRFRSWLLDPPEYRTQRNRLLPIEGGDGSTLNLDFTTGVLDSRLTFSRLSNATFTDSSGIIKHCVQNLFYNTNWVASSLPSGWLLNPASNGSYTWNNNGTVTFNTTTGQRQFIYPDFPYITTTPGLPYTCGFKVISTTNNPVFGEVFVEGGTNGTLSGIIRKINGSTTVIRNGLPETVSNSTVILDGDVLEITAINSNTQWYPRIGLGVNTGTPAARSITITQPQANNGTTLQTYTPNTNTATGYFGPRFDYDSRPEFLGTLKGLLVEAVNTNFARYSETFNALSWSTQGLSGSAITNTTQTNPAGFNTCVRLVEDNTNTGHTVYTTSTLDLSITAQHTFSVFVRGDGTRSLAGIRITLGGAATDYSVIFDLTDGTTGTPYTNGSPGTPVLKAVKYPDNWWRLSITINAPSTSTLFYIYNATTKNASAGVQGYTGNGTNGIYIWGAQVEKQPEATSYIPTGTGTVQKTTDSLSISGSNLNWYSPTYSEGTFYFRGSIINTPTGYTRLFALTASSNVSTATGTVANINTGVAASNSNRPFLNTLNTINNDVDIYVPVGAAVSNNVEFGVAATYKSGDWRISSKNLAATSAYATVSYATWGNNLFLSNVNGVSMPAVWYKQFKFYPIRLTNSQMDILSA